MALWLPGSQLPAHRTPGPFRPTEARAQFRGQCQNGTFSVAGEEKPGETPLTRRAALLSASVGLPMTLIPELPGHVEAPGVGRRSGHALAASDGKTRNLPLEELRFSEVWSKLGRLFTAWGKCWTPEIIAGDIRDRQYFVTGQMSRAIYRDDCYFIDPMNEVGGLDNYILGISLFLDPSCASNELVSVSSTEPNIIEATSTLSGYFRYVPWKPYLSPITVNTRYTVDSEGLISLHEEKWSISNPEAWRITLTPAFLEQGEICRTYQKQ